MEAEVTQAQQKQERQNGCEKAEAIPFHLGSSIMLRSLSNNALKAKTRVVGVLENDAILIESPVFKGEDSLSARVGSDVICIYFFEGCIYKFKTRLGQVLIKDIVCIDYPQHFEAEQLRKFARIAVHLEAEIVIGTEKLLINGDIRDISEGGCRLELHSLFPIEKGDTLEVTCELPNDQLIQDIKCTVMNMRYLPDGKRTEVGVSFSGPEGELEKVRRFCNMCMYFKV